MRGEVGNPRGTTWFSWFATRQAGHVARRQLLAAGIERGLIDRRLASGYLIPIQRGVYRIAHQAPIRLEREFAAVLRCGPGALVAHRSAAHVYEFLSYPTAGEVWITNTSGRGATAAGVRVHRTRVLEPRDVFTWLTSSSGLPARS